MNDQEKEDNNIKHVWEYTLDRVFDTLDIIVRQLTSGRWIMTVAAAYILIHSAKTSSDPSKIIDICKDIVIFYFVVRNSIQQQGGAK